MTMLPLTLPFYKGKKGTQGAIQFNLQRPHYYAKNNPKLKNYDGRYIPDTQDYVEWQGVQEKDLTSREGCVFMEITSTKEADVYDWDNKIVMALSVNDLGKLLSLLTGNKAKPDVAGGGEESFVHDPSMGKADQGKVMKVLTVSSPKGLKVGCCFNAYMKKEGKETKHFVNLNGDDVVILRECIRSVIPKCLAW